MSAAIAIREDQAIAPIGPSENGHGELASVEIERFKEYLRKHLTNDLVLQVLQECLLRHNWNYNSIDLQQALNDLERRDGGEYMMLKVLIEGFATKEGLVMLDPKLVTASYKQRVKQMEELKSMSRLRRFVYRLAQAITGLINEKGETEAIQEAIQITGEVQLGRDELAVLELKKSQAIYDANQMMTNASNEVRQKLEAVDSQATEKTERLYHNAREAINKEREQANKEFADIRTETTAMRRQVVRLELETSRLLKANPAIGRAATGPSFSDGDSQSQRYRFSPRQSPSVSRSDSPSVSESPSPSASPSAS